MSLGIKILVCFLAGLGAGVGTGFAGMSAAAVIGPMLITFLGVPAYQAVGIGLASDVLASAVSAWTYKKSGNLDVKNSLVLLASVLCATVAGSLAAKLVPERAMSGTMQIAMIVLGLKFIVKPVVTTKEQMLEQSRKSRIIKSVFGGRCHRGLSAVCGRGRRHDDAVCADVVSGLRNARCRGNKRIYHVVYGAYRRNQSFYYRRHAGCVCVWFCA